MNNLAPMGYYRLLTGGLEMKRKLCIKLATTEVLMKLIQREQQKYPFSLKTKNVIELMNCSQTQAYEALERGDIPGARKIPGMGWRINRDVFLTWLYSEEVREFD